MEDQNKKRNKKVVQGRQAPFCLGVLGGMGPLATYHFLSRLTELTPVKSDQDHIRVVCVSATDIPDRTKSLLSVDASRRLGDQTLLSFLKKEVQGLVTAGASHIVIPCNTAHAVWSEISASSPVPVLNLVRSANQAVFAKQTSGKRFVSGKPKVLLLGTKGLYEKQVYQSAESGDLIDWIIPTDKEKDYLMRLIYLIKSGSPIRPLTLKFEAFFRPYLNGVGKCDLILLGCTELSLLSKNLSPSIAKKVLDPLEVMARECVRLSRERRVDRQFFHKNFRQL